MRAQPAGIRSTKKQPVVKVEEDDEEVQRPPMKKQKDIMIKIIDTNADEEWKIYTDQTGKFPKKVEPRQSIRHGII